MEEEKEEIQNTRFKKKRQKLLFVYIFKTCTGGVALGHFLS